MYSKIIFSLNFLVFLTSTVQAHSIIISVNEEKQCLREINDLVHKNFPVENINSDDMMCNVYGKNDDKSATPCSLTAGKPVTMRWWDSIYKIIHPGHKGPCAAYISRPGTNKWAKIWEDGFRDGKWCTERLIESDGAMTFTLPKELADGKWILRGEAIALHVAHNVGGAQFYMRCADIVVTNGGGQEPATNLVPIPGYVKERDPGVLYSIYKNVVGTDYIVPGPPITTFANTMSNTTSTDSIEAPKTNDTTAQDSTGSQEAKKDEITSTGGEGDASKPQTEDIPKVDSGDTSSTIPDSSASHDHASHQSSDDQAQSGGDQAAEEERKRQEQIKQEQQAREKEQHEKDRQEQQAREKAQHESIQQQQQQQQQEHDLEGSNTYEHHGKKCKHGAMKQKRK